MDKTISPSPAGQLSMATYRLLNNSLGWLCFLIAAASYLLTVEPTASFWDCPEFIAQGTKLEVGHPPGNPIFMLTARFFVTIFGGDMHNAALAINCMSALLSAATILLLFWTVTHLVKKIVVRDQADTVSLPRMVVIMGAGVCGALAYAWSDTFWFSAVESEVYAFSSFCTALVFWLILKWENRADSVGSDRYLILIAYVIGVSIAVHLLNLLCIPAIVLVIYYRKFKKVNAKGSLLALAVSFVVVALILYGLVPGFIKVAQGVELFFVNVLGTTYNVGVLVYALLLVALLVYTIYCIYHRGNPWLIKALVALSVILSGVTFVTDSPLVWVMLIGALCVYLFAFCRRFSYRVFSVIMTSLLVIFIGYSSYALLLIRASANPPMNQNAPDNVFTLASYLNREQYGQNPLIYGPVFAEKVVGYDVDDGSGNAVYIIPVDEEGAPYTELADGYKRDLNGSVIDNGDYVYTRAVEGEPRYVRKVWKSDLSEAPELNMLFTRMYSTNPDHVQNYKSWGLIENEDIDYWKRRIPQATREQWAQQRYIMPSDLAYYAPSLQSCAVYYDDNGNPQRPYDYVWKPSFLDNMRYFFNYQLLHMYWRYFMWNFAGRQNDIQGNGEPHLGNWISGIPVIDNARLGDQSLLPAQYTTGNKGHNVYYMLPLLLGILGLVWQSLMKHPSNPDRGIQQFWVVFFLFFMTGIAIVLYLNQPPGQPRERDYAFAGSFYAFAIWIGMGVPALWSLLRLALGMGKKAKEADKKAGDDPAMQRKRATTSLACAAAAAAVGLIVPLQMVSQTWDDHDRSHRYTTRDFGENYLNSLDENAIIFTNGDNDTFPLWYAQEVEGVRTDVRVVNLSYLTTDWYANQMRYPYYNAGPVKMTATPGDYAYDRLQVSYIRDNGSGRVAAVPTLEAFYENPYRDALLSGSGKELPVLSTPSMYSPVDHEAVYRAFGIDPESPDSVTKLPYLVDNIEMNGLGGGSRAFFLNTLLSFDIVANSIADGFTRPVYFASTVPNSYYLGMRPYLSSTGMAYQVTPFRDAPGSVLADKAYENIVSKFKWGGLDVPDHNKDLYLDETVRRMVSTVRNTMATTATDLMGTEMYNTGPEYFGELPATDFARKWAEDHGLPIPKTRYDMARYLLNLMEEKLPAEVTPYDGIELYVIPAYLKLYRHTGNADDLQRARALIDASLRGYLGFMEYALSLDSVNFSKLSTDAAYVRMNVPTLLAYLNYIDLLEAARAISDPEERESALLDIDEAVDVELINGQYAQINPMLFMQGYTTEDIYNALSRPGIDSRTRDFYVLMAHILEVNGQLGVDPMKNTSEYFRGRTISPTSIRQFDRFIYN